VTGSSALSCQTRDALAHHAAARSITPLVAFRPLIIQSTRLMLADSYSGAAVRTPGRAVEVRIVDSGVVAGTSGAPWTTGSSTAIGLAGGLQGGGREGDVPYVQFRPEEHRVTTRLALNRPVAR
jgi:hypothetical protein